jgi:hypothetical protein
MTAPMVTLRAQLEDLGRRLGRLAATSWFRLLVASLLVVCHLVAFSRAGESRLGLPFNSAPGHAPYYSDPDASAVRGYPRQPHYWSRMLVSRWDAQHYIGFAVRGLTSCPTDSNAATDLDYLDCGLNWFATFGKAGGLVADTTGLPADVVLLLLAIIAAIALNYLWTNKAITDRLGRLEAYGTLLAFNLFPSAFYIVTPYTEGATLALVLAGFLCLLRERWVLSALLVGAATALRLTAGGFGVALGCALLYAAWDHHRAGKADWYRPLYAIPLVMWGLVVYVIVLKLSVGDAFAFFRAQAAFAEAQGDGGWAFGRLVDAPFYLRGFSSQHLDSIVVIGTFAVIALTGREVLRRFGRTASIFLVVAAVLLACAPLAIDRSQYWGLNRYFLLLPLAFFAMGVMARKHFAVYVLWLALCAALYWHVELCSYISQGNPGTCPCLGRLEFTMPF